MFNNKYSSSLGAYSFKLYFNIYYLLNLTDQMIKGTYNMGNNFILYVDVTFEYIFNKSTICITIFEIKIIPYIQ